MIMKVENNRDITAKDLHRDKELNHNNVSYVTITRFLNDNDLKARIKVRVPDITEVNMEKRVSWAKKLGRKKVVFFNKIMFTDESHLGPQKGGKHFVRKR